MDCTPHCLAMHCMRRTWPTLWDALAAKRTAPDRALAALAALAARLKAALHRHARAVQDAHAMGGHEEEKAELAAYEAALSTYLTGAAIIMRTGLHCGLLLSGHAALQCLRPQASLQMDVAVFS